MKTISHSKIISNLLVISSFLTTIAAASAADNTTTTTTAGQSDVGGQSSPRGRSLIGSILLRAANLNSITRAYQNYATTEQSNEDEDLNPDSINQERPPGQLLMPTDSGEDPLETTTLETTATIDDDNDDTGNSHISISQQQAPTAGFTSLSTDTESELEVDSNNVSAIIMSSTNRAPPVTVAASKRHGAPITCEQAYTQCALRKACAPALKAYSDHCHELISNQTNECSPKCLDAMIALRSSEEGDDLANCDCQSNDYCVASKQRSLLCKPQVDQAVDPKTVVSCSTASLICMADQSCAPALGFYYRNCRSLLTQRHCSARCNNSLTVLHRQSRAHKLISCQCDGSEEFPCVRLKTFTEQLCLNKQPSSASSMINGGGGREDDDDDVHLTTEEESSNLTNNPENFVLGAPIQSGQDEVEDDRDAAIEESNYNGIQLLEDNWIPLISGRYFTNSHQLGTQQSKQRHKQKENQHKQQQQTRRVQRTMRQQRARSANATQHEGKRSRFSRIFMFAASTSSASSINAAGNSFIHYWLASMMVVAIVVFGQPRAVNVY